MVEVKNGEVFNLERAQRAIENSFNVGEINTTEGPVKEKLAKSLGGNMDPHQSHDAWLKGILVTFDIKGNGVFMPEFQRYHFLELQMSQSSMHSMEKFMTSDYDPFTKYVDPEVKEIAKRNYKNWHLKKEELDELEKDLSNLKDKRDEELKNCEYSNLKEEDVHEKFDDLIENIEKLTIPKKRLEVYESFEKLVHSLPRGFELWATVNTNYLQLKTIVIQRAHHKNQEDWGAFVNFCYSLPKFRELCGFTESKWDIDNLFPFYDPEN